MLRKEHLENGIVQVTFVVPGGVWADRIALVGDFNDWNPDTHLLHQTHGEEDWHIVLDLEAGHTYRFRYLVDGHDWMDDDHADAYEPNPFGEVDSVVNT